MFAYAPVEVFAVIGSNEFLCEPKQCYVPLLYKFVYMFIQINNIACKLSVNVRTRVTIRPIVVRQVGIFYI